MLTYTVEDLMEKVRLFLMTKDVALENHASQLCNVGQFLKCHRHSRPGAHCNDCSSQVGYSAGLELPGSMVEFPAEKGLEFAYCFSQAVQVEF